MTKNSIRALTIDDLVSGVLCLIDRGEHGKMMAINHGCYAAVEIPDPKLGPRRVDIPTMYNTDRYRPNYGNRQGLPIFLNKAN